MIKLKESNDTLSTSVDIINQIDKWVNQELGLYNPAINTRNSGLIELVYTIEDSQEFGVMFSLLDDISNVDYLNSSSTVNEHNSNQVFRKTGDLQFIINLIANFDDDNYQLSINYNKEEY